MTDPSNTPMRRRAVLRFGPGELETALGIDGLILDTRVDLMRDDIRLLVSSDLAEWCPPGNEPPIVDIDDLRPPADPEPHKTDGAVLAELGTDGLRWAAGLSEVLGAAYAVSDRTPSGGNCLDPAVLDVLDPAGGGTLHVWMANAIEAGRSAGYAKGLDDGQRSTFPLVVTEQADPGPVPIAALHGDAWPTS